MGNETQPWTATPPPDVPVPRAAGRRRWAGRLKPLARPAAGLAAIAAGTAIVVLAVALFRGGFADTVAVTVHAPRAGLVMYPDAEVKLRGVTVGAVDSIVERADGTAEIELAIDRADLTRIPGDVTVDIASTTVFGAKYIQLVPPAQPGTGHLEPGQVFAAENVTVEINTVFEQLTQVLGEIQPEKLNETLGALATAMRGRGDRVGQMMVDLEAFLAKLEPGLPALRADLAMAPEVTRTYADAAPALLETVGNATRLSRTVVAEQQQLDVLLMSLIGLADTGNRVVGESGPGLVSAMDVLAPTTELTNRYHQALTCALDGLSYLSSVTPVQVPGIGLSANFLWGVEPYRYPEHLPKVAASGGPQCSMLPVAYEDFPPFVVADVGANPQAGPFRSGLTLNTASLAEALFGPAATGKGAPR
ncbi:MCE family protein [Nocardia carnea]|uniref:MCE family protein n=1 Tax=Nocardia carnea TaxID=37328 RepID=UPI0024542667|nr:MCE family protein [Nocardia carnea]